MAAVTIDRDMVQAAGDAVMSRFGFDRWGWEPFDHGNQIGVGGWSGDMKHAVRTTIPAWSRSEVSKAFQESGTAIARYFETKSKNQNG